MCEHVERRCCISTLIQDRTEFTRCSEVVKFREIGNEGMRCTVLRLVYSLITLEWQRDDLIFQHKENIEWLGNYFKVYSC